MDWRNQTCRRADNFVRCNRLGTVLFSTPLLCLQRHGAAADLGPIRATRCDSFGDQETILLKRILIGVGLPVFLTFSSMFAQQQKSARPPRPGVSAPGVKRDIATITPIAVFPVEGTPDWQVVTPDAVWVANGPKNTIHKL